MSLIVFPAIDLKGGQVVRLAEGDMDRATIYGDDPAAQAMLFAEAGAEYLHVVDLDGAFAGEPVNPGAVEAIVAAFPGHVQLVVGIRTRASIDRWFDLGVSRAVIGTAASSGENASGISVNTSKSDGESVGLVGVSDNGPVSVPASTDAGGSHPRDAARPSKSAVSAARAPEGPHLAPLSLSGLVLDISSLHKPLRLERAYRSSEKWAD